MKAIQVYLMFDGNCREAMSLYAQALDAKLSMNTYAEMSGGGSGAVQGGDRILHARLEKDGAVMMASDCGPNMQVHQGDNFSVTIDCESVEEEERIFAALGEGGTVTMPLQETFWGARFGMLKDRFGIGWMLNCDLPKSS